MNVLAESSGAAVPVLQSLIGFAASPEAFEEIGGRGAALLRIGTGSGACHHAPCSAAGLCGRSGRVERSLIFCQQLILRRNVITRTQYSSCLGQGCLQAADELCLYCSKL